MDADHTIIKEEMSFIRQKMSDIGEHLARNTAILEQNTDSLKEHMRRTEILETQMDIALLPIRVGRVLGYIIATGAAVGSAIAGFWQLIK